MSNHLDCRCPGRRPALFSRRDWLKASANGFGLVALSSLLADPAYGNPIAPPGSHFSPKAKRVIFCFMDGGVSHVDSFDPKPKLAEVDGQPATDIANPTANTDRKWLNSPWKFRQHGESGMPVSDGEQQRRPAELGLVGDVRTWEREPQLAGLRRAELWRDSVRRAGDLLQRFLARDRAGHTLDGPR
jgi:hypothetical protein